MSKARSRTGQRLGAAEIESLLAKKFPAPAYAFMPQLNQGTGGNTGRIADAVAFSLWPSRGLDLHGFEIKVARSDLKLELSNPEKAEAISRYCDFWWLVVPKGLTDGEIIPASWGVMEVAGGAVRVTRDAPRTETKPLDRKIIAAMFRRFHGTVPQLQTNYVFIDDVEAEVEKRIERESRARTADVDREASDFRLAVERFELESGIKVTDRWTSGKIGGVVKALLERGGVNATVETLRLQQRAFQRSANEIAACVERVEEAMKGSES